MSRNRIIRGATVPGTNGGSFAPHHKREADPAALTVDETPAPIRVRIGARQQGVDDQYGYLVNVTYSNHDFQQILVSTHGEGGPVFAGLDRIDPAVVERCGGTLTPKFIRKFYGV